METLNGFLSLYKPKIPSHINHQPTYIIWFRQPVYDNNAKIEASLELISFDRLHTALSYKYTTIGFSLTENGVE